ncbi:hypothetical protein [Oricola nitratireducens]|uniref:hypothetical protein n=1 Tax=Oricola nitratireducens TaxID=2775868 RepID=UPI001867A052|nr:hypothetical protein [Oricola nitratireducens]
MIGAGEGQDLMDAIAISEASLPRRHMTGRPARAPHRSSLHSMELLEQAVVPPAGGMAAVNGVPRETDHTSGVLWIYARTVGDVRHRAPSRRGERETELRRYTGMRLSK